MAYWRTRSDLSSAQFPLVSEWMGRSVILPLYDQNTDSTISVTDAYKDKGKPQVFYMHNVVPTAQGFKSVGYLPHLKAATYVRPDFDSAFLLRNPDTDRFVYSPGSDGGVQLQNNIYDPYIGEWRAYNLASLVAKPLITTAYINSQTYIFIQGTGCFLYDKTIPDLVPVTLTFLDITGILGITAANGYLIAFSTTGTVFWSSLADPLDFVPSLITGAGSGVVNDIKGPIALCLQISGGFLVYSERNAVGASYTGNALFPFTFKEVTNSGGIQSAEDVLSDSSNAEHYAITTSGLQKFDRQVATTVFPEITDFLVSRIFEDFNTVTRVFEVTYLNAPCVHKLTLCANRYLIVSYGMVSLTHAIVYDLVMKRYAKLKIAHVDAIDFFPPETAASPELYDMKGSLGFLQSDGTVQTVDFSADSATAQGVFIIGKFQFDRNSVIQLNGFTWECANANGSFDSFILPSLDGANFDAAVTPFLFASKGRTRDYLRRLCCTNFALGVIGGFNLVCNSVEFTKGGSR